MKNVIITGASSGVGKATAEILKSENLILISSNESKLKPVAEMLNADYYICDLSDAEEIQKLMEKISDKYEKIDCLINCAGMWISGDVSKMEEPEFKEMNELNRIKKVIDTNVFAIVAMTKCIFPIMKKQGYGQIININSQSGVVCEPPYPVYNATKKGSYAFRQAVQDDLARNNIRITDVCPGLIQTDFYKNANDELPKEIMDLGLFSEEVAKVVKYIFDLPEDIMVPSIEIKSMREF